MNKLIHTAILVVAASGAAAQAGATPPLTGGASGCVATTSALDLDPSYATYRRVVLGDTSVRSPRAAVASAQGSQLVPGSYALYLMRNGLPREVALAQALQAGEAPTPTASGTPPAPLELTSYEAYQRTVLARSLEEILRDRARGVDLAAHPKMSGDAR